MRARRLVLVGLLAVPLAGLSACVHEREKALVTLEDGALAPRGAAASSSGGGGSSRRGGGAFDRRASISSGNEGGAGGGRGRSDDGASAVPALPVSAPVVDGAPASAAIAAADDGGVRIVEGPRIGTSSAAPAHRPIPAGVSLERLAKEKFLSATTEIRAQKATLYLPAAYAAEASLQGATVTEEGPGRRTAVGGATLVLRRLTIRAARLTLVSKSDPEADVQLSARGDVSLRSDQPASIVEETGLRSLLLRNDGYTPLR